MTRSIKEILADVSDEKYASSTMRVEDARALVEEMMYLLGQPLNDLLCAVDADNTATEEDVKQAIAVGYNAVDGF